MKILTISGSSRPESSNARLLEALRMLPSQQDIYRYTEIDQLPLFSTMLDQHPWPPAVLKWRAALKEADAVIICTPEYLHNLPGLIKNALEWVTTSGELVQKPVLSITFTPSPPRGEKAMQSLRWSLQALDARLVAELNLYGNGISFGKDGRIVEEEVREALTEILDGL